MEPYQRSSPILKSRSVTPPPQQLSPPPNRTRNGNDDSDRTAPQGLLSAAPYLTGLGMSREIVVFRPLTAQQIASLTAYMQPIEGVPPPAAPPPLPMITVSCEEGPYASHFYELLRDADGESVEDRELLVAPYWMERSQTPEEIAVERRFQEDEGRWNEEYWLKVEEARREGLRKLKEAQRKSALGLNRAVALTDGPPVATATNNNGKGSSGTVSRANGTSSSKTGHGSNGASLASTVNGTHSSSTAAANGGGDSHSNNPIASKRKDSLANTIASSASSSRWNSSVKPTSDNAFHRETSLASVNSSVLEFMSSTSTTTSTRTNERKQSIGVMMVRKGSDATGGKGGRGAVQSSSASSRFQMTRPSSLLKAAAGPARPSLQQSEDTGMRMAAGHASPSPPQPDVFRRKGSIGSAGPMMRRSAASRPDGLLRLEASPPAIDSTPPPNRSSAANRQLSPTVRISLVQPASPPLAAAEDPASPEATPPELPRTAAGSHSVVIATGPTQPSQQSATTATVSVLPEYLTTWSMPLCLRTRKQSSGMKRVRSAKLASHYIAAPPPPMGGHDQYSESTPVSLSSTPSGFAAMPDILLSSQTLTRGPLTPSSDRGASCSPKAEGGKNGRIQPFDACSDGSNGGGDAILLQSSQQQHRSTPTSTMPFFATTATMDNNNGSANNRSSSKSPSLLMKSPQPNDAATNAFLRSLHHASINSHGVQQHSEEAAADIELQLSTQTDEGSQGPLHSEKQSSVVDWSEDRLQQQQQQQHRGDAPAKVGPRLTDDGTSSSGGAVFTKPQHQEEEVASVLDQTTSSTIGVFPMNPSILSGDYEQGYSPSPMVPSPYVVAGSSEIRGGRVAPVHSKALDKTHRQGGLATTAAAPTGRPVAPPSGAAGTSNKSAIAGPPPPVVRQGKSESKSCCLIS